MACIYIMTSGWTNHNPFDASVQYALTVDSATVCAGWCVDVHVPAYKERAIRLNFSTTALEIMEPWPILKKFHFLIFQKFSRNLRSGKTKKFKRPQAQIQAVMLNPGKVAKPCFVSNEIEIQAQI